RPVRQVLAPREEALGDLVRVGNGAHFLDVDTDLTRAGKGVDRDVVAVRQVEVQSGAREAWRKRGLAAPAIDELDRLGAFAQALAKQPAQQRACGDVPPA